MTTVRRAAVAPALVAGVTAGCSLASVALYAGAGIGLPGVVEGHGAAGWSAGLVLGLVGALVLRDAPGNAVGPLLAAAGCLLAAGGVADAALRRPAVTGAAADWVSWVASTWWVPAILAVLQVPMLYPDGRPASRRWRPLVAVSAVAAVVGTVCVAVGIEAEYDGVANPLPSPVAEDVALGLAGVCFAVVLAVAVVAVADLLRRMRRTTEPDRTRLAWFAAAMTLLLVSLLLPWTWADLLVQALAWSCLAVGVVRHRLFDIEAVLSRSLVYGVLTGAAFLGYLAIAALAGSRLEPGVFPALGAALAALLLASARQRLQRLVDRLLYGERRDPLGALTALGRRLEGSVNPDEVLPLVAGVARQSLHLPYAAVVLAGEDRPAAEAGEPTAEVATYPLVYGGLVVGVLAAGLRRGDRSMSPADDRVLRAFAAQAAAAAHAASVTRDLRRSRERIVLAREEERRRLRRDLHDQLGPTLAGVRLGLETARRTAQREGSSTGELLGSLHQEVSVSLEDVRRIVADLRPPVLDEVGLVAALRQYADLVTSRSGMVVSVEGSDLAGLPAAVELAAYRIALEGVNNAARHADARHCTVRLTPGRELRLTIEDDGTSRRPRGTGVGLASMAERAEELGGTCSVTSVAGRGTRVEATLP